MDGGGVGAAASLHLGRLNADLTRRSGALTQGLKDYFAGLGLTAWMSNNAAQELGALYPTCDAAQLQARAAALERLLPGVDVAQMVRRDYVVLLADPGARHAVPTQ
jgi:hypothetical protein